jgi:hypothetical protein
LSACEIHFRASTELNFTESQAQDETSHSGVRPVPIAAGLAAKISRNPTLRTQFLRLSFDDGWKDLEEGARRISFKCEPDECFLLPNVQWIVNCIALS